MGATLTIAERFVRRWVSLPASFLLAAGASLVSATVYVPPAEASFLADNLDLNSSGNSLQITNSRFQGQKFKTTTDSIITSVTMKLGLADPNFTSNDRPTSGSVDLEIWDASGSGQDLPNSIVATVGTVQVSQLSTASFQDFLFSSLSIWLNPNSNYYLVAAPKNLSGCTSGAASCEAFVAATASTEFSGFTPPVRVRSDSRGSTWSDLGGSNLRQRIEARAVPGPLPLMGAAAAFGWSRRLRRRCNRSLTA